jgi:hypothetical protein
VDSTSKEMGVWYPWKYLNYAAAFQDPIAGVRERLRDVSGKFDPEGAFQTLVTAVKLKRC